MAEFAYNNSKNTNTDHTPFKLNCDYHLCSISFEDKYDTCSRSFSAKKLAIKLKKLINICHQNLLYAQDLQKRAYDKEVKSWSYVSDEKVLFNSKHIKTKKNWKLKTKLFRPFQVSHQVGKQVYKLEIPVRWKYHNMFHVLLLK